MKWIKDTVFKNKETGDSYILIGFSKMTAQDKKRLSEWPDSEVETECGYGLCSCYTLEDRE